ncbi:major vault protein-like [Ictidomys tridecemlineatus]|uniref:major vault protein-like n=1 Tax=Ictidomys tridecemlineatus TaxID=43179 RepID=UPI0006823718|nr:major vault protein-like [Ictidomys tridecemlineatus]KAG3259618.1 major vault protein-like [Ictidomys tridecemlineatus]
MRYYTQQIKLATFQDITPLQVVLPNTALHLKALLDFEDKDGYKIVAGDEWLFEGPGTYIPRKEVEVVEIIQATVIRQNQALRLRARKECLDRDGKERVTGEEWLVRSVGAYLPAVFEEVLDLVDAVILTEKTALHLRARQNFQDLRGVTRRTGEEWLVTVQDTAAHVPDVHEEVLGVVPITTLGPQNYCVVLDPVGPDGKNQLGQKRVIKGEKSFFLQPGERLERGIQDVYVLSEQQGLLLRALQSLEEGEEEEKVSHQAGDRWLIRGPLEYVPSAKVEVVEERQAIPLDENEGIYVQDVKTGRVRAVIGSTYMHEAQRLEQEARGRLERQKILDQSEAEKARKELLELEALSMAVESTGTAKAEAESRAEAARIEGEGSVLQAKLKAQALAIETMGMLQ